MAAIKDINFFAPGKIVYHVYGHLIKKSDNIESNVQKYICTSGAITDKSHRDSLFVNVIKEGLLGKDYNSKMYMGDIGIFEDPNRNTYNLNRVFASMPDALEFIIQIQNEMMDLPSDQKHIEHYKSKEYMDEQKHMYSAW